MTKENTNKYIYYQNKKIAVVKRKHEMKYTLSSGRKCL